MNAFLAKINREIDEVAIESAKAGKAEQRALDDFLLAKAALRKLLRKGQEMHTESGAYLLDRETGKPISDATLQRVQRKIADAEAEYIRAFTAASQAAGRLNNLHKQREEWERLGEYEASQRAAESAMTPREKAIRDARALLAGGSNGSH